MVDKILKLVENNLGKTRLLFVLLAAPAMYFFISGNHTLGVVFSAVSAVPGGFARYVETKDSGIALGLVLLCANGLISVLFGVAIGFAAFIFGLAFTTKLLKF